MWPRRVRWFLTIVTAVAVAMPWQASDARGEQDADPIVPRAIAAMERATAFFHGRVAVHGGYVWRCSADLARREGERRASPTEIWVQPPGTPTVGLAYLRAHAATGDERFLAAARDAAVALLHGQLESGGWTDSIEFDPRGRSADRYRGGRGRAKGRNYSTLDDDKTQSVLRFLMQLDERQGFRDAAVHEAVITALDAVLAAQFPNGGFPQGWRGAVGDEPAATLRASYPDYDWRTEQRIKEYWDLPTLNDGLAGTVARTLHIAHGIYGDARFRTALERLGHFLRLAQMPQPQPAWAQQYTRTMHPAWARKFEPPAIAGAESEDVVDALLFLHEVTGDPQLLEPVGPALRWMRQSLLPDGRLARFYELRTNRPLYLTRDTYELTYDDDRLPTHYSFSKKPRLEELEGRFAAVRDGRAAAGRPSLQSLRRDAERIIDGLDPTGRWLATADDKPWPRAEPRDPPARSTTDGPFVSSALFARNLTRLADYVEAARAAAAGHEPASR